MNDPMLGAGNDQRRQGVGVCPKLRLSHSGKGRLASPDRVIAEVERVLGNGALVRSSGIRRVEELDWWQEAKTSSSVT